MGAREEEHRVLLAHAAAQSEALMTGRETGNAYRDCPGNRPNTTFVLPALDPASLGSLVALYEHKVFVQGVLWGVNSFDQFGVELGKTIAGRILPALSGQKAQLHPATSHLLDVVHKLAQSD
jgi:glucose-6-phosphate isomerase